MQPDPVEPMLTAWGHNLKEARNGRSLQHIARLADTTKSTISRIENGKLSPSDALRLRLAAALNTTVEVLFPYPKQGSAA